jgi:16S rRNA (guanine(527)-N(7))-methyltransferase RsmG
VFAELLRQRLGCAVELSSFQVAQLEKHFELLQRWNKVLNLTSVHGTEEIIERHYCESLFLAKHLPPGTLRVADIGSGAGFPGFPVAVLRPECSVALIESHQRKSVFLRESSRHVPNVSVIAKRAETVEERFDWVVSRAVKYADIEESIGLMAASVGLLAGPDQPFGKRFTWNTPIQLPWGTSRFLWMGNVSRETL